MEEETLLYLQLHKLSAIKSEEELEHILTTLWRTRKTGLTTDDKSYVQSVLNVSTAGEVDPVLACLRLLIRKCVRQNVCGDDILKLFPLDLSLAVQSNLVMLLRKYQSKWKEEMSSDQHLLAKHRISELANASLPQPVMSSPPSECLASLWPREDNSVAALNTKNGGAPMPAVAEAIVSCLPPLPVQHDVSGPENMGILPRLKSMTWTLENRNRGTTNKVAVISLKLQDYTKSPLGEMEVKFQLNKDTLEALLRSITYIGEQLSLFDQSSEPLHKKQRQ